jgi:hypothetical protein
VNPLSIGEPDLIYGCDALPEFLPEHGLICTPDLRFPKWVDNR